MKSTIFKLNQPNASSKKPWLLFLLVLVLLVTIISAGYLLYQQRSQPALDKNTTDPTNSSAKNTDQSRSKINQTNNSGVTSEQIPVNADLNIKEIATTQTNGTVNSSAIVSGTSVTGNCVFSYSSQDSRTVVEESTSLPLNGGQKCNISIPEVNFDKAGEWTLSVTFYQNDTKTSASEKVVIN